MVLYVHIDVVGVSKGQNANAKERAMAWGGGGGRQSEQVRNQSSSKFESVITFQSIYV